MKGLIDASLGRLPSLAEAEEFRLMAKELSELGVYSIFLSNDTQSMSLKLYSPGVLGATISKLPVL